MLRGLVFVTGSQKTKQNHKLFENVEHFKILGSYNNN